jgi:hypothetical protein
MPTIPAFRVLTTYATLVARWHIGALSLLPPRCHSSGSSVRKPASSVEINRMCHLLEPTPGLVIDVLHPNAAWNGVYLVIIVGVVELLHLRFAKPRREPSMSRQAAMRQCLVGSLLILFGVCYEAWIGWPSDVVRRRWLIREEAFLTPACAHTVLDPANNAILLVQGVPAVLLFLLPVIIGASCIGGALIDRGLPLRGW